MRVGDSRPSRQASNYLLPKNLTVLRITRQVQSALERQAVQPTPQCRAKVIPPLTLPACPRPIQSPGSGIRPGAWQWPLTLMIHAGKNR